MGEKSWNQGVTLLRRGAIRLSSHEPNSAALAKSWESEQKPPGSAARSWQEDTYVTLCDLM